MQPKMIVVFIAFVLSACGGAEQELQADCNVLVKDVEAVTEFANMDIDAKTFCRCMLSTLATKPKDVQRKISTALSVIAAEMTESDLGAEAAVRRIRRKSMLTPDDPPSDDFLAGLGLTSALLEEVGKGLEQGGDCKVG